MRKTIAVRSLLRAFCISCLTSALLETQLHAAVLVSADAVTGMNSGTRKSTALSGEVTSEWGGAFEDVSGRARSRARFGVLNAYAEGHAGYRGPNNILSTFATGTAYFTDDITIDAPGRTGQSGFMTFNVAIHGSLAAALRGPGPEDPLASFRSYAQTSFHVGQDGGIRVNRETLYADGTTTIVGLPFLNRLETIVVPFTYGTTFELKIFLGAATTFRTEFGADCISDIGNTLEWGGIVSVTDSGGNAVTNYTTATGSGTDYSAPILDLPRLTLSVLSPGQLQLSWSTNYPAFTLESSTALSSGWQTVTNSTGIAGEQHTLTIDASSRSEFFRLRKN